MALSAELTKNALFQTVFLAILLLGLSILNCIYTISLSHLQVDRWRIVRQTLRRRLSDWGTSVWLHVTSCPGNGLSAL